MSRNCRFPRDQLLTRRSRARRNFQTGRSSLVTVVTRTYAPRLAVFRRPNACSHPHTIDRLIGPSRRLVLLSVTYFVNEKKNNKPLIRGLINYKPIISPPSFRRRFEIRPAAIGHVPDTGAGRTNTRTSRVVSVCEP